MGDSTYLMQPKFMSNQVLAAYAEKLDKYAKEKEIKTIFIAFHGGEPLLADGLFYQNAVEIIKARVTCAKIYFVLQTNGTLLNDQWCSLLKELDIQVGISIDGTKEFHDKFRVYHNGKGSYNDVIKGIQKRDEYGEGGLITVIDPQIDPLELYSFYKLQKAKYINILLPDNHYDSFVNMEEKERKALTDYGSWLIQLYECWSNDKINRPVISFFENIISILLGYNKGDELIGRKKNRALCIETDGSIEVVDPLRVCGNGFTKNNLNVLNHEIKDIENIPLFKLYYDSHDILCDKCSNCSVKDVCGGGYLPHRYSRINGFYNPSIYCASLKKIICHIQNDIYQSLPDYIFKKLDVELLDINHSREQNLRDNDVHNSNKFFLESFKEKV